MQMTFMNPLYPRVSHLSMRPPSLWARRTMDLWDAVAEGSTCHFPGQFPRGRDAGSWNQLLASWRLAPVHPSETAPGSHGMECCKTGAGRKKRTVDTTTVAVIGVPLLQPSGLAQYWLNRAASVAPSRIIRDPWRALSLGWYVCCVSAPVFIL